jgi:hypothetical protein
MYQGFEAEKNSDHLEVRFEIKIDAGVLGKNVLLC